jgi:hypothetical protein
LKVETLKPYHFETLPAHHSAQRYGLPLLTYNAPNNWRTPKRKTENWEKILNGGPYFEGTLQKPTGVSESSPVAGTIENSTFSEILDAGRTREVQQIRPAATHLLSVDCLYQMSKKNCKREF